MRHSNILISEEGTVKITDFGTSAWLNSSPYALTRIGSPPYMAPEQFLGKASYPLDIYSIGCIFYEMLVGRPPIFDPDPFKILEKAQQGKVTPPRLKNMRVPKEIDALIMKCLAPRVEDRIQTAHEIINELSKIKGQTEKPPELEDIFARIRAREQRTSNLCWNCHRPLPYKAKTCPYCGESV
jgi:Serine/threonine protein kinase